MNFERERLKYLQSGIKPNADQSELSDGHLVVSQAERNSN